MAKATRRNNATAANVGYEAELWRMADALRGSMDAAEYKHVVLGLIFLEKLEDRIREDRKMLRYDIPSPYFPCSRHSTHVSASY